MGTLSIAGRTVTVTQDEDKKKKTTKGREEGRLTGGAAPA
jgi:hypothetical protein